MEKKNKLFYGWVVVGVLFLITMLPMVFVSNFFSYYQDPVCKELGATYVQFNIASLLATITAIAFSVSCAGLVTKGNTRMIMFIGALVTAVSYFAQSYVTKIWQLYVTFFIANFALSAITYVPINFLISQWFEDKKALITAIVFTGGGIGGFLFSIPMGNLINNVGWRAGFKVTAVVLLVVAVIIFLLIRKSPAEMGLEPYRETNKSGEIEEKKAEQWEGVTTKQATKSIAFLLYAFCMLFCGFVAAGILTQVPAYLTEIAINYTIVMTVFNAVSIVAKLIMGRVLDKIGVEIGALFMGVIAAVAIVFLIKANATAPVMTPAIIFACILPFGSCITALAPPLLTGKIFGYKDYGKIYGLGNALFMLGAMIGPILSSAIHDSQKTYVPAWRICLVVYVLLGIFAFLAVKTGKKLRVAPATPTEEAKAE